MPLPWGGVWQWWSLGILSSSVFLWLYDSRQKAAYTLASTLRLQREFHVKPPKTEKSQGEKLNYNCARLPNGPISRSAFSAVRVMAHTVIFRKSIMYLKAIHAVHCRYGKSLGGLCTLKPWAPYVAWTNRTTDKCLSTSWLLWSLLL